MGFNPTSLKKNGNGVADWTFKEAWVVLVIVVVKSSLLQIVALLDFGGNIFTQFFLKRSGMSLWFLKERTWTFQSEVTIVVRSANSLGVVLNKTNKLQCMQNNILCFPHNHQKPGPKVSMKQTCNPQATSCGWTHTTQVDILQLHRHHLFPQIFVFRWEYFQQVWNTILNICLWAKKTLIIWALAVLKAVFQEVGDKRIRGPCLWTCLLWYFQGALLKQLSDLQTYSKRC